ncbi:GNAT family N-acetyltransferase [Holospora undulata]|uniref:Acetyltransferase (GNAT) family protein n=1 Tax=Holospora undulata HU1 TaxID=1321371 RepID=A0A061JFS1_9PROT|nr:GNAT family N-acetyltransferase [Holospora undulata]ETZ04485.1 acetyltransferase (GNAT) family protein [Holospora undulata HU1]
MIADYKLSPATNAEAETLNDKVNSFVAQQVSFDGDTEILKDYVIKENGLIIAGIRSCFYLGECLAINVLFVEESHRLKGLGTLLLNQAEADARAMGAKMSHLDTFNHQAKDFYLKHGYEIFGVLENCPAEHKRSG